MGFRFIDLFAGIGGFRKGFESIGGKCVFTCEIDKFARQTYRANFDVDHDIAEDITEVKDVPDHDVLLAGFPCQPFSLAGVSKKNSMGRKHGFECETKGTLFFDVARILDKCRPKAFVLENVKNLMSHDKGKTFRVIRDTLFDLGYSFSWRVIDASHFVPQHRERIFIVGFRERVDLDLDIPLDDGPRLHSILHRHGDLDEVPYTRPDGTADHKYILSDKMWNYLQAYKAKHEAKGNGFGYGLVDGDSVARTLSARYGKDGSEILINRIGNPRRLTPRECSRLMGFDGPGESDFVIPVSDTQAYKQFGNSVSPPVVAAIAEHMKGVL